MVRISSLDNPISIRDRRQARAHHLVVALAVFVRRLALMPGDVLPRGVLGQRDVEKREPHGVVCGRRRALQLQALEGGDVLVAHPVANRAVVERVLSRHPSRIKEVHLFKREGRWAGGCGMSSTAQAPTKSIYESFPAPTLQSVGWTV